MPPSDAGPSAHADILALARAHGIELTDALRVDETGLDFQVVMADDVAGRAWVLRLPRRADVVAGIPAEARTLAFLAARLSVAVPDWQVASPALVAYPRLTDPTALSFDPVTHAVTWSIDPDAPAYTETLAEALAELHGIPIEDAVGAGLTCRTPDEVRRAHLADLHTVAREIGIGEALERELQTWLDDDATWPSFSTVVHGDLYAGHTLVDAAGRVSGIIDWTEAEVSDPSIDFTGHRMVFGEAGLRRLLSAYARAGGRTWAAMEQVHARSAFAPVRYGLFALASGDPTHLAAARAQLGTP